MTLRAPTKLGEWLGANGPATPSDPNYQRNVDRIAGLGVELVRLNHDMAWLGRKDYMPKVVKGIQACFNAGLTPVPVISGSPDGLAGQGGQPAPMNIPKVQDRIAAGLDELFDAGVRVIECQNEWDGPGVGGAAGVNVPVTARVHRVVRELWHAIGTDGQADVWCIPGGTSSAAMSGLYADTAWSQLVACEGMHALDGAAHHAGAYPYDPHAPAEQSKQSNGFYQVQRVAGVAQHAAPTTLPRCWVTEVPWPTDAKGIGNEAKAADRARRDLLTLVDWMGMGICGPVFVYHGCPDGTPGHDPSNDFGLFRRDGTAKPTATVVKEFAAQGVPSGLTL